MEIIALFIAIGVIGLTATVLWLFWILIGRPYAVSSGLIPMTAYDHIVLAWKAERQGRWADALAEYDKALALNPTDPDARIRRDSLLAAHPELSGSGLEERSS